MKSVYILLFFALVPLAAQVKITQGPDRIGVEIDGQPFTEFFISSNVPKPFLHPLRAASGTIVTRRYPMEAVEGEAKDHPHHRGAWFTHGEVNGYDFWANEASQKGVGKGKGKIALRKVGELSSRKKSGSIDVVFEWQHPDGKPMLTETRRMVFYSHPTLRMVDFDITLRAIDEPVDFGDTKEGTFAIRLASELEEPGPRSIAKPPRTGQMLSSEGKRTEKEIWGTRAPWVDYSGDIAGEKVGVAIFDHPANPKHPTYWHARGYGLFAANIFGVHDFTRGSGGDGSMKLDPGASLRFRYRVVVHPGDAESAGLAGLYKKYAGD
jgi:Methane oxygenase PmoA